MIIDFFFGLTGCVIQVELYLFSSESDSRGVFFEHWRCILLFLTHKKERFPTLRDSVMFIYPFIYTDLKCFRGVPR